MQYTYIRHSCWLIGQNWIHHGIVLSLKYFDTLLGNSKEGLSELSNYILHWAPYCVKHLIPSRPILVPPHYNLITLPLSLSLLLSARVHFIIRKQGEIIYPFPNFSGWIVWSLGFLAATKQLYEWFSPSVCLSVRLSVTHFWLCSHHRIIMKFSGVITNDRSDVHAKSQGQRSKVKVTEVNIPLNRFRTVTPVWIPIWWWNVAYSLMLLRKVAQL